MLAAAEGVGLRCVYPNGAAFAPRGEAWPTVGWITGDDTTVRPAFRDMTTYVPVDTLAPKLASVCRLFETEVWIAPVHHWAAELAHGRDDAGGNLGPLLLKHGIDPAPLMHLTQADAVAFDDATVLRAFCAELFQKMWKSDFTLLVPGVLCVATLHHHRQVWWRFRDETMRARLRPCDS